MATRPKVTHRSGCPVSIALDLLGDRWSLLLVRDLMVRGYRTFREFQRAGEGIATNILSDRLHRLEAGGILGRETTPRRWPQHPLSAHRERHRARPGHA